MFVFQVCISITLLMSVVREEGFQLPTLSQALPFAVPAVLYCLNNNISIHMQLHMDPATFQVLLTILCTAQAMAIWSLESCEIFCCEYFGDLKGAANFWIFTCGAVKRFELLCLKYICHYCGMTLQLVGVTKYFPRVWG